MTNDDEGVDGAEWALPQARPRLKREAPTSAEVRSYICVSTPYCKRSDSIAHTDRPTLVRVYADTYDFEYRIQDRS